MFTYYSTSEMIDYMCFIKLTVEMIITLSNEVIEKERKL